MPSCCIKWCGKNSGTSNFKNNNITFHRFPKQTETKSLWIEATKREDWVPSEKSVICSRHFTTDCFLLMKNRRRLLEGAIPTLYLPSLTNVPEQISKSTVNQSSYTHTEIREFASIPIIASNQDPVPSSSSDNIVPFSQDPVTSHSIPDAGVATPKSRKRQCSASYTSPSLYDSPVKKQLCRRLNELSTSLIAKNMKIKCLQDKNRYLKKRVANLSKILFELEKQSLITSENKTILESVGVQNKEIIKRQMLQNEKGHTIKTKYSPELRSFALTLHFYSAKAYNYVRKTFTTCLPSPKTLTKWYQCINGRPGFTEEAMKALKMKANQAGGNLICTLIFDEIKLKSKVEYHPAAQRTYGYVDFGAGLTTDCNDECTEALVFLIVPLNYRFKVPIGYFLTNGTKGDQKATLVTKALDLCYENNVIVKAVTFDGCPGNLAMAKSLGCNFEPTNLKTHFKHPSSQEDVFIFLDPVHMIKLVRNSFEFYKIFNDAQGNQIKWDFIEKLNTLQETEKFYLANKLRSAHVNFKTNIMNVKLATQLFSRSIAEALLFCNKELKLRDFNNVEPTSHMLLLLNDLFDILDSKVHGYGFKRAINEESQAKIFEKFDECKSFLMSLSVTGKKNNKVGQISLIESPRYTGFLGLCVSMESAKGLFHTLVANKECGIKYIPFHKISQDHIELFFCNVRSHGGCSDNPTPRLFESIYKKILVHTELITGANGNCVPLENITILDCSSAIDRINIRQNRLEEDSSRDLENEDDEHRELELVQLTRFSESAIEYIAGYVVNALKKKIKCATCLEGLLSEKEREKRSLISYKDKGGLTYPSNSVVKICRRCELIIKTFDDIKNIKSPNRFIYLVTKTMNSFVDEEHFSEISYHRLDNETNHLGDLRKCIIEKYINTRLAFLTKSDTTTRKVRKIYTKLIHFKSQ